MKQKILVLALLSISLSVYSQVGIKTEKPIGIFNIDGQKDNAGSLTPSAAQQRNDLVFLTNGNLGLGVTAPVQKLDILTGGTSASPIAGFKLDDGTQGEGYFLMSEADGTAYWKEVAVTKPTILGTWGTSVITSDDSSSAPLEIYTGANITLPNGKWVVNFGLNLNITADVPHKSGFWQKAYLSSSSTTREQNGFEIIGSNTTPYMGYATAITKSTNAANSINFLSGSSVVVVTGNSATIYVLLKNSKRQLGATTGNMWEFDPSLNDMYLYAMPVNR